MDIIHLISLEDEKVCNLAHRILISPNNHSDNSSYNSSNSNTNSNSNNNNINNNIESVLNNEHMKMHFKRRCACRDSSLRITE